MNSVVPVPNLSGTDMNYLIRCGTVINGVERVSEQGIPISELKWMTENNRVRAKEWMEYFGKFTVSPLWDNGPLESLRFIRKKYPVERFIEERTERFTPKHHPSNVDEFYFTVEYWVIREPIITYLRSVAEEGDKVHVERLAALFARLGVSGKSWDERLTDKARYLWSLDLTPENVFSKIGKRKGGV